MQESGFSKVIEDFLGKGGVYVGSSAGSVLAGPSTEPFKTLEYEQGIAPNLQSFDGLGITEFIILPHYGKEKYRLENEQVVQECEGKYPLYKLTDEQAIIVKDGSIQLLG